MCVCVCMCVCMCVCVCVCVCVWIETIFPRSWSLPIFSSLDTFSRSVLFAFSFSPLYCNSSYFPRMKNSAVVLLHHCDASTLDRHSVVRFFALRSAVPLPRTYGTGGHATEVPFPTLSRYRHTIEIWLGRRVIKLCFVLIVRHLV